MCWVFDAAWAFSSCGGRGAPLWLWCMGFSLRWFSCCGARALGSWGSTTAARGSGSCGALACGILLDQGSNLCPLQLADRFLTTGPQGSPWKVMSYWTAREGPKTTNSLWPAEYSSSGDRHCSAGRRVTAAQMMTTEPSLVGQPWGGCE